MDSFQDILSDMREAGDVLYLRPAVRDDVLASFMEDVKPLIRVVTEVDSFFYEIKPVDPRQQSFIWSPKQIGAPVPVEPVGEAFFISIGYLFKPSMAEICSAVMDSDVRYDSTHLWVRESSAQRVTFKDGTSGWGADVCFFRAL